MTTKPYLSIVVASYNMTRELPRTILSLAPPYQRDLDSIIYEVIVVDNGSQNPPSHDFLAPPGLNLRVIHCNFGSASPVQALNLGLAACQGNLIGVMIDGARMASPRLLAAAYRAARLHDRAIVYTQSLMLGTQPQWEFRSNGYNQDVEDELLESIAWPEDGYRLFEISSFYNQTAGIGRWLDPGFETNALFMPRQLWEECGGYDIRFQSPGGGLASHDLFSRAAERPDTQIVAIIGEATFHQFHDLSASSSSSEAVDQVTQFFREYGKLRKKPARPVVGDCWTFQLNSRGDVSKTTTQTCTKTLEDRYIELLKQVLLNEPALELEARSNLLRALNPSTELEEQQQSNEVRRLKRDRKHGLWDGQLPEGFTMIGRRRLDHLAECTISLITDGIPGDFMECGVWRGGACMLIAGILNAYGVLNRKVWLADAFEGLPPPDPEKDGSAPAAFTYERLNDYGLAVSLEQVKENMARLDLLGDNIEFVKGWFDETLASAPVQHLALLRLDGDYYASTIPPLLHLYPKLSPGGIIIIDDYQLPGCRKAVHEYRERYGITEPIRKIDWTGAFWRKEA